MVSRVAARHVRMADSPVGKKVYINRDQAEYFGFPYNGGEGYKAIVAADTLIRSAHGGYDQKHLDILKPLGGRTILMTHDGYGWYTIQRVV
jgi:hypothetical protein